MATFAQILKVWNSLTSPNNFPVQQKAGLFYQIKYFTRGNFCPDSKSMELFDFANKVQQKAGLFYKINLKRFIYETTNLLVDWEVYMTCQ